MVTYLRCICTFIGGGSFHNPTPPPCPFNPLPEPTDLIHDVTVRALLTSTEATPTNVAKLRAYVTKTAPQAAPFLTEGDLTQVHLCCVFVCVYMHSYIVQARPVVDPVRKQVHAYLQNICIYTYVVCSSSPAGASAGPSSRSTSSTSGSGSSSWGVRTWRMDRWVYIYICMYKWW